MDANIKTEANTKPAVSVPAGLTDEEKEQLKRECEAAGEPPTPAEPEPMRDLAEAHAELQRELQVRERCFGRWIKEGKMSRVDAVDRYARLQSALVYLRRFATSAGVQLDDSKTAEEVPF